MFEPIRIPTLRAALAWLLVLGALSSHPRSEVIDQVAAVVENQVITLSDLLWTLRYRRQEIPQDPVERRELLLQTLEQLVEQKLIAREAAQTPGILVTPQLVETRLAAYRDQFPSEEEFQAKLRSMQMSPNDLRELIRRQLAVLQFVKVRFEPFIIVLPDQITDYYLNELTPELVASQQTPPPIEVVEEQIRQILTLQRTNAEVDRWVRNSRSKVEIAILLYRSPDWLPNLPPQLQGELQLGPAFPGS